MMPAADRILRSRARGGGAGIATYQLYGITLASDYRFASPLVPASGPADVTFDCGADPPRAEAELVPVHTSTPGDPAGSAFVFGRGDGFDLVRITGGADFYVWDDRIVCHLPDPRHRYLVEIGLFGLVLAFWLERRGTVTLHASAVVLDGDGVAFLGAKGAGKTTTAAGIVLGGDPLLTDDLLALDLTAGEVRAHPGYPQMRMWPDLASHVAGSLDGLDILHPDFDKRRVPLHRFGVLADAPVRLGAVYLLERGDARGVTIAALPGRHGLVELLRHSYLPEEVAAFGWQPRRLRDLGQVSAAVPIRRLRYPPGLEHLPQIRAAVAHDLQR